MKNKLVSLALIFALAMMAQSSMAADIVVFTTAGYEAAIRDMSAGTTILVNDGTTARIGITGNGGVVNWTNLNIPANKLLDFNFSENGQIALNNVLSGMSRFAGKLNSSGANGRIIISNPNGILMEGTSVVNANSLVLTTHSANWDGEKNGNVVLTKTAGAGGNYYGVSTLSGAKMTLADDLAIIANGIDMTSPNIVAGKDIRLVTADGATYVAGALNNVVASTVAPNTVIYPTKTSTKTGDINGIKIASGSFKSTDGKIYLTATKDHVLVQNATFNADAKIDAEKNVTLAGTSMTSKVSLYKDLEINAGEDVLLTNVRIMQDYSQKANITGNNVTIRNFANTYYYTDGSILGETNVQARNNINLYCTNILNNLSLTAVGDIHAEGSTLTRNVGETATLNARNVSIDKYVWYDSKGGEYGIYSVNKGNLDITALEKISLKNNGPTVQPNQLPTATNLTADEVYIEDYGFNSVNLNANKITGIKAFVKNDFNASGFDTLALSNSKIGGSLLIKDGEQTTITNSSITNDLFVDTFNTFDATNLKVGGSSTFINGIILSLAGTKVSGNMAVTDTANWNMTNTDVVGDISLVGATNYTGDTNTSNDGQDYPLNSDDKDNVATYVNRLATGTAPNVTPAPPSFNPKGFAAEDQEDYKEQFLRKSVRKPNGNVVTVSSFRAE